MIVGILEAFNFHDQKGFEPGDYIYIANCNILNTHKKQGVKIISGMNKIIEHWGKELGVKFIVADIYDHNINMLGIAKYYKY